MKPIVALAGVTVIVVAMSALFAPTASAEEPVVTYEFPRDGQTFNAPLTVLQQCFAAPINVKDLDKGGDFKFQLTKPSGFNLGMRIVFQPDGYGLTVFPGTAPGTDEGKWTFQWRVTDRETLDPLEGETVYSVGPGGTEPSAETPPECTEAGFPSGVASPTPGNGEGDGDRGPDVFLLALLTIGAAGGAGIVALLGYAVRNRVGFWPHRPPEGGGTKEQHH